VTSSNVRNKGAKILVREKFSLSLQREELANKKPGKRFCSDGNGINKLRSGHSASELPVMYCFDKGGIESDVVSRGEGGHSPGIRVRKIQFEPDFQESSDCLHIRHQFQRSSHPTWKGEANCKCLKNKWSRNYGVGSIGK
jgi:hypothetical protein